MLFIYITLIFFVLFFHRGHSKHYDDPLEAEYGRIQHASIIFRHGDRSPMSVYPQDPYKDYLWPEGWGQVLDKGKLRMYNLGKWFRKRYNGLVPPVYRSESIFVQSSDKDRAIVSAECFLYGFYIDTEPVRWKEYEKWRPIPVHSIPKKYDNLINFGLTKSCPTEHKRKNDFESGPEISELYNEILSIMPYIEQHSGLNFTNLSKYSSLKLISNLRGILKVQAENNFELLNWTKNVFPEPLMSIKLRMVKYYWMDKNRQRLALGPMFKSVLGDMYEKTTNENFSQVLHVYSAHDTILDGLYSSLDNFEERADYGTTLIFELRKNATENIITVSKKTTGDAHLLSLPSCGPGCTLDQFTLLMKHLTFEDWNEECQGTSKATAVAWSNAFFITTVPLIILKIKQILCLNNF